MAEMVSAIDADRLARCFVEAGWHDNVDSLAEQITRLPLGGDLLPLLGYGSSGDSKLTIGWPDDWSGVDESLFGRRLLFFPHVVPVGRRVAWVSSRLGRAIDERPDWFAVLKTAAAKFDPVRDLLLTAPQTTADRFLERAAILFGLRLLRIELDETRTLTQWLERVRQQLQRPVAQVTDVISNSVWLSPPVADVTDESLLRRPLADRVMVAIAEQIVALQIRSGGNLHELLRRRLRNSIHELGSVWLALGDSLVPTAVASELQSLGAVGWVLSPKSSEPAEQTTMNGVGEVLPIGERRFNELPINGELLVHCTRRKAGPWPDQSEEEFVDELLLSDDAASHSAFAALVRIVTQQRLKASASGIRGGFEIVSFAAIGLNELAERNIFRRHRGRWDFEPYGICLRRELLIQLGAKPVIYGDDSRWSAMRESEKPYFQLQQTRARGGATVIDWSNEVEWRVLGNVDLSQAPRDSVMLFVPTESEAQQLSAISPWPVIVLPS